MSEPLEEPQLSLALICSAVAFHAKTSAEPERVQGSKESAPAFGSSSTASSPPPSRASSSSKTSPAAKGGTCPRCGKGCASSATERVPLGFLPPTWERPSYESESSSSESWPTPTTVERAMSPESVEKAQANGQTVRLAGSVAMYPTPMRSDGERGNLRWPTPQAFDARGPEQRSPEATARQLRRGKEDGSVRTTTGNLREEVHRWPSASASDHKGVSRPGQRRGQLEEAVLFPTPTAASYGSGQNGCPHDGRERFAGAGAPSLSTIAKNWPTATVSDKTSSRRHGYMNTGHSGTDAERRHRFPPGRGDDDGWRAYVAAGSPEPAVRRGADGLPAGVGRAYRIHRSRYSSGATCSSWKRRCPPVCGSDRPHR